MYYVFFETGNDAFFSGITDAFCSIVLKFIVDVCKKKKFDVHIKNLASLNCTLFSGVYCGNQECADNQIVFTSDQLEKFEISMIHTKLDFLRAENYSQDIKLCLNIQRMLESFQIIKRQGIKYIPIKGRQNHTEYLRSYIKETNKLKDKAEGFTYIRAKTNSDYDYFMANTELPNVIVCDRFQQICGMLIEKL